MADVRAEFELSFDKAQKASDTLLSNIKKALEGVKGDTLGQNISKSLSLAEFKVAKLKNTLESLGQNKIDLNLKNDVINTKIGQLQSKINELTSKPASVTVTAQIATAQGQIAQLQNNLAKVGTTGAKIDLQTSQAQGQIKKLESDIASGITSGAKGGGLGIKREFTNLGISQLLKSQIIAGLAVQGIQSGISAISSALKDGFTKGINVESQFTSLKTIFKGVESDAKKASQEINKFATETPYSVSQVTDAYIKLKNYGLDSSEKALRSFGNTASALGKPLNQMIEAVADAGTGQFERLKEFGIKSEVEGDKVKFTFDGVTTTVGKNSKEITDYLTTIGETKFAGGMEAQSKTLGGTLSTLGDSFDTVLYKILGVENGIVVQGGIFDQLRNGANFLLKTLSDPAFLSSVDGIAKGIISGFSTASDFISKIDFNNLILQGQNLLSGLQPVFNTIGNVVVGTFDKFKNINFGDLGSKLKNIFGKINLQPAIDIFEKLKTSITNNLQKIDLNKTLDGITSFANGVVDLSTEILGSEIFKATVGVAIDLLVASFDKLTQIDTSLFSSALKITGEALTAISQNQLAVDIITALTVALGGLALIGTTLSWIAGIGTAVAGIGTAFATVSAGFVAFFAPVTAGFGFVVGIIGTVVTAIAGFVATVGLIPILIGIAVTALVAILIGLVVLFVLNFEAIKNFTMAFVGAVGTFFTNLGASIWNAITTAWALISATFNSGIAFVVGAVTGFVNGVVGFFVNLYTQVTSYANLLWTTAKSLFSAGVSALQNYIANFVPNITNNFNNLKNTVTNTITGLWESAKTKFSEAVNNLKTTVEGMVTNVKSSFDKMKSSIIQVVEGIDLSRMGSDIVQGLINGIKNMGGQLSGALSGVVSGAVDSAKAFLGIKSPSRLMMQVGKYTGEGFVIGIDKMAKDAMESMTNLVTPQDSLGLNLSSIPISQNMAEATRPQIQNRPSNSSSMTTNNNQKTESRVYNNFSNVMSSFGSLGLANT